MKHLISAVLILAFASLVASAQILPKVEPCKVTTERMPKVRGLYLGMPFPEVKANFKNLVTNAPDEKGLRIALSGDILRPDFSDVRSVTFVFIDGELQKFKLEYKAGTDFSSIEDYAGKLSESLTVPKSSWSYTVSKDGGFAQAKCYGFDVTGILVDIAAGQRLNLEKESIYLTPTMLLRQKEVEKRKAKQKQEKTDSFKP